MDKVDQTNQKALGKLYFFIIYYILLIFINNIKINFIHNKYFIIYFVKRCDNQ